MFILLPPQSHATIINAFGKDISIPESCVLRAHTTIHKDATFFCDEAFITLLAKDTAEIDNLKKAKDVISSKSYLVNELDVTQITMAFVEHNQNLLNFNFICQRNECIGISSKKNDLFDAILEQLRNESQ